MSLHQTYRIDGEGILQLGKFVEPLQQGFRVDAVLDLNDQTGAVGQVGEVLDVGDTGDLFGLYQGLNLVDDSLWSDHVRQLGDDDAAASWRNLLDAGGSTDLEGATAGAIGVGDAIKTDDSSTGRQIRSGHEPHDLVKVGVWMIEHMTESCHNLDEVMWWDVGCHTHCDTRSPVDEQVREGGRQH